MSTPNQYQELPPLQMQVEVQRPASIPATTIRYTLLRRDVIAANFRTIIRSRYLMSLWGIVIVLVCRDALDSPPVANTGVMHKALFCVILGALYLMFFIGVTTAVTAGLVLTRKNRGVIGEHRLTIEEERLRESTEYNDSLHKWNGCFRTVRTRRYLYLYVTDTQCHVVPRTRPLIEGDLSTFDALLQPRTRRAIRRGEQV